MRARPWKAWLASAAAWATGAALGVALGSWLTTAGQVGAGVGIDPRRDLLVLPAIAFTAVFFAALGILRIAEEHRGRRATRRPEAVPDPHRAAAGRDDDVA